MEQAGVPSNRQALKQQISFMVSCTTSFPRIPTPSLARPLLGLQSHFTHDLREYLPFGDAKGIPISTGMFSLWYFDLLQGSTNVLKELEATPRILDARSIPKE